MNELDFRVVAIVAIVILVMAVLGYRLLNRDPNVRRTRWGIFVERERYDEEPDAEEQQPTVPQWPRRSDHAD